MSHLAARLVLALALALLAAGAQAQEKPGRGYPSRGRLGVEVQPMTAELREFFRAPADQGVLIVRIEAGRPADGAGLRVGDVLVAAAGEPLVRPLDLIRIVARAPVREKLGLEVVRSGEVLRIEVVPDGEPLARALDLRPEELLPMLPGFERRGGGIAERLEAIERRLERIERSLGTEAAKPENPAAE